MGDHKSVTEIAKEYGYTREAVCNMCHARGQRFAYRLTPNGKFYIIPERFRDYIERKQQQTREEDVRYEVSRYSTLTQRTSRRDFA